MVAELASVAPDGSGQQVGYIPIERVRNDVPQVRRDWRHDEGNERLDALTQSIRNHGVLQPIEVTPTDDGRYQVLIGARRYVAARRAGLGYLPAIVRAARPEECLLLQLVENVVRHNLAPLDEAHAYAELLRQRGGSAESLASLVGVSANHIRNCVRLAADAVLGEAVAQERIQKSAAHALSYLSPEYAQPLYDCLRAGGSVTMQDVQDAREQRKRDDAPLPRAVESTAQGDAILRLRETGLSVNAIAKHLGVPKETVVGRFRRARQEHPDWQDPLEGNAGQVHARQNIAAAHRLRREGQSVSAIAATLGRSVSAVKLYLAAHPVDVPAAPNVTVNGVTLDPLIAKAQERAEAEHEAQPQATDVLEPAPHPRPLRSPLPWENHDEPPVRYGVDNAGRVHPQPRPQQAAPRQPAAPAASIARPAEPLQCVQAPPAVVDDPDVRRLRFMLQGAQQPCHDLLGAMLNLGREKGWSCHELWRKLDQASGTR